MFTDPVITNPFVADGIIPDKYGLRTLLEYRARLFSVPHTPRGTAPPPGDHMDIITAVGTTPDTSRKTELHPWSSPQAPDARDGEDALSALTKTLDLTTLGPLHPAFFAVMRVVPPPYIRRSADAERRKRQCEEHAPSSFVDRVLRMARAVVVGADIMREAEPMLLTWHWADDLLAVATGSELDRVCAFHFSKNDWELAGERHHSLIDMRCIAFRPYAGRALAIGGRRGLTLLDRRDLQTLHVRGHTHIHSLDWSPDGLLLASASSVDGSVRLWDVGTRTSRHVSAGALVRFNPDPDAQILFVADGAGLNFRLWNLRTWTSERWGSLSGPVVAATWTADGTALLFSTLGQSCIHVLSLSRDKGSDAAITNSQLTVLPREGPGGTPILIEVDPTSERLAVVYEVPGDESPGIETNPVVREDLHRRFAVAIYATQFHPTFSMVPIGYVGGPLDSGPPVAIKFKPVPIGAAGASLTCMWRSGQITFSHFFFNAARN